jgi:hypothetical protein
MDSSGLFAAPGASIYVPSEVEREAFAWMQGRMIELVLRHDARRFEATFDQRDLERTAREDAWLLHYRQLAVVFHLRDELLGSILPRIKRRLSFESPRALFVEEPPTRGRIDWPRTSAASWRERPGEVPLEVYTRQRRRHFGTPENLLTVCTVLEYRHAAQQLLDAERENDAVLALRHGLVDIVEECSRELVFPQFVGLVTECSRIVEGYAPFRTEDLEQQVEESLIPGHNSAYDDLLAWRTKFRMLQLLDLAIDTSTPPVLGAIPARDNYLYQVWLFYELADLLQKEGRLLRWDRDKMTIHYAWGEGEARQQYRLQHDQAIPVFWTTDNPAIPAPGVRPDFYIERVIGLSKRKSTIADHEPGYLLDAKYYRPRDSDQAPSNPIKRMIADLQLTREKYGALLFAFQTGSVGAGQFSASAPQARSEAQGSLRDTAERHSQQGLLYHLAPSPIQEMAQRSSPRVGIWRVRPAKEEAGTIGDVLAEILNEAHQTLVIADTLQG